MNKIFDSRQWTDGSLFLLWYLQPSNISGINCPLGLSGRTAIAADLELEPTAGPVSELSSRVSAGCGGGCYRGGLVFGLVLTLYTRVLVVTCLLSCCRSIPFLVNTSNKKEHFFYPNFKSLTVLLSQFNLKTTKLFSVDSRSSLFSRSILH